MNNTFEFKIDGGRDDYQNISADLVWLLNQAHDKELNIIKVTVSEGVEKDYIEGLALEIFQETGVDLILE